jgi:hypothetical protein
MQTARDKIACVVTLVGTLSGIAVGLSQTWEGLRAYADARCTEALSAQRSSPDQRGGFSAQLGEWRSD